MRAWLSLIFTFLFKVVLEKKRRVTHSLRQVESWEGFLRNHFENSSGYFSLSRSLYLRVPLVLPLLEEEIEKVTIGPLILPPSECLRCLLQSARNSAALSLVRSADDELHVRPGMGASVVFCKRVRWSLSPA